MIVTSQEDIDSVTRVKGNDFSKIQGRFNTRLSLSSASVDEVIKRRILAKNDEADKLLRLMYRQNAATMRNLSRAGRGLLVVSIALSVYSVASAEDKAGAARRELAATGAGIGGGIAGGALAGLACGPGAPVCVTVGAFVGGALAAFGVDFFW